jgi:tetratricopeptide (TPR) repeat protein
VNYPAGARITSRLRRTRRLRGNLCRPSRHAAVAKGRPWSDWRAIGSAGVHADAIVLDRDGGTAEDSGGVSGGARRQPALWDHGSCARARRPAPIESALPRARNCARPNNRSIRARRRSCLRRCSSFGAPLSHWEATGDARPQAEVLLQIGIAAERLGQTADAVASYKGSADIYRRLQDRPNLAFALQYLGGRYEVTGDLGNANAAYDESLKVSREAHDRVGEANAMLNPAFSKAQRKDSA